MSDQNPIHRDRGRQDDASQPYEDAKETFSESEAQIGRQASEHDEMQRNLTDEERKELLEQAAEERFKETGREQSGGSGPSH